VRDPQKAKELQTLGVKLFQGDVTDKESMRQGMKGVDGVYHVAGWYKIGARDRSDGERVNIGGTRNVLELMQELSIPKGVYTSTCAINSDTHGEVVNENYRFYGKHLSEYDRTKAIAHELAQEFSTLRDNMISFLKGQLPALPDQAGNCWAHVDDIVQGHILAMEKGSVGETYIIAGERYTFKEAFELASQITGKPAPRTLPAQLFRLLSLLVKPLDKLMPPNYTSEGLRVIAGVTYMGDNSKAKRELGYAPRPFHEGWGETLRHEMKLLRMN
jgi:nucleoside-diphosphate-sugar epimerase